MQIKQRRQFIKGQSGYHQNGSNGKAKERKRVTKADEGKVSNKNQSISTLTKEL